MSIASQRYLAVWLRRLSTDRIERCLSASRDAARIVVEPVKSALRICGMNDAAAALGIKHGITLADARAMHPSLEVHQADHAADLVLLEAVADWCDRYTPLIGLDPPDGLMLDVSGCAHLFGGEASMRCDLIARLARQGLQAHAGLADTPGCAWAIARYGDTPSALPEGQYDALLPLPLTALRIDREIVSALAQAGLKRIADVIDRPRAPLAARFGEEFLRRLDQALGREEETITPRLPPPSYVAERRFPEPVALQADVLGTIEQLARELGHVMERRHMGARLLQAALFRVDGKVHRIEAGAGQPLRDPERIQNLFVERLNVVGDECDPGFGYDVIRLSALTVEPLGAVQIGLANEDHTSELKHFIDRLSARFGARRVVRQLPCNTHIPEFAVTNAPAQRAQDDRTIPPPVQDRLVPTRPLRLFARPEPIETVAEVPDGPPTRFRWRQVSHEVAAAEGPERIAMEWWRDEHGRALTRDYFHVESKQGTRVWLYREGLYGRETSQPRWFVHGLFA
jgi:protein ImuB